MREVARRAGVSKAAVSYVLNGQADSMRIPEETRERILQAVRELNYHPNRLARSLAHKASHTVAVVMQYPAIFAGWSGFTNELMRGVTDAAIAQGLDVMLHTRSPEPGWTADGSDAVAAEVANLTDGRVDGALLLRDLDDPLITALRRKGFPTVLMFSHSDDPEEWFVDCDNVQGARQAVSHLLDLGHRRIAHLAGPARSGTGAERLQGYLDTLAEAGVDVPDEWVVRLHPGDDFTPVERMFRHGASAVPTALFAWSDEVAVRAIRILREMDRAVPRDVSVVGFDSTAVCDHTDPPLTSVRQPVYEMAALALDLLARRIRGERPRETRVRTAPALVVRRSTAAPTAAREGEQSHAA